jgi:hypothetical protein
MQLASLGTGSINQREVISSAHRLTLVEGEVRRLPGAFCEVTVVAGTLWMSLDGIDQVIQAGETAKLDCNKDFAVVQAVGRRAATFELARRI